MTVKEYMAKSGVERGKGYDYLWNALERKTKNPTLTFSSIKMHIGNENKCCADSVEKQVGRAIKNSFPLMDGKLKETLFKGYDKPPSTARYVSIVAYAINRKII